MGETFQERSLESQLQTYEEIDRKIEPGPPGTNQEEAAAAELIGIGELLKAWRQRQLSLSDSEKRHYQDFNYEIKDKFDHFFRQARNLSLQAMLRVGEKKVYAHELRWDKYRDGYGLYQEQELPEGFEIALTYCGLHNVYSSTSRDRPYWESDLQQVFVGGSDLGFGEFSSGLAVSINQAAITLIEGGELKLVKLDPE